MLNEIGRETLQTIISSVENSKNKPLFMEGKEVMAGKYGVENTKEVLNLAKVVALAIVKEVKKDGFQVTDLGAFLKSAEFDASLQPALTDIALVPMEMGELGLIDGVALGRHAYEMVQEVMEALRK